MAPLIIGYAIISMVCILIGFSHIYGLEGKIRIRDILVTGSMSIFWILILLAKIIKVLEIILQKLWDWSEKNKTINKFLNKQIF